MTVRLAVVVQHSPLRADILPRLLAGLAAPLVVTDPGGELSNAWRCYRECLRADVGDATHLAVLQDDAIVCDHFEEAAAAAITAKPDVAIAWFLAGQPAVTAHAATQALKRREHWVKIADRDWMPTVAASYPVGMAREIADWCDAKKPDARGDDSIVGDFFRAHRHQYQRWAVIPSLAQHLDDVPSLIGRVHLNGRNPGRTAHIFVGDQDARTIDWSK